MICKRYPAITDRLWEGNFLTSRTVHLTREELESNLHEAVVFSCRTSWNRMCTEVGYGMFLSEAKERIIKSKAKQVIMLPPPVDNWRYPSADFMKHLVWLFSNTDILIIVTAQD